MVDQPEPCADDVRSDKRPHVARDRCLFGCCELAETLGEALRRLHDDLSYQSWQSRPWLAAALAEWDAQDEALNDGSKCEST